MSSCLLIMLLLLTHIISALSSSDAQFRFPSYADCNDSICGNSTISYPFGQCGPLFAECEVDINATQISLQLEHFTTRVIGDITKSSYSTRTLQISQDYIGDPSITYDWLINDQFFKLSHGYATGTILNCTQQQADLLKKMTPSDCRGSNNHCFFVPDIQFPSCQRHTIIVPTNESYNITADKNFEWLRGRAIEISWSIPDDCHSCQRSGGRCFSYFNGQSYEHYCICPNDNVHSKNCFDGSVVPRKRLPQARLSAKAKAVCAFVSIVLVSCIVARRQFCHKKSHSKEDQSNQKEDQYIRAFMDPLDTRPPTLENFLNYYSSQMPTRYSYTRIKAYTNNFAEKVGKGGFGTVYKGKLRSGGLIGVKILDKSKQSEQQFIAEVATVGTTCHINLVRLLGYCCKGSKRALVYEYMVNGSLDKYILGGHHEELDWKQLHSIAVGTARGIAYLHEDCRNRILHCDIKPHNILLDANFLPKVADFGLAKILDKEHSHISAAQGGTLGYAAPEMWSIVYGPVTDRSDVYSYGMLIMEMVGGRKNFDNRESRSSKFYYPEWAFKQVEKGNFGSLRNGNMSKEDEGIAKRLSSVGLWCIQFNASHRPSMSQVIQMLEGVVDITTPPFPFPVDTTPLQLSAFDQSSSIYALEAEMIHPRSTQRAKSMPGFRKSIQHSIEENVTYSL
eukprot:PITA_08144